MRDDYADPDPDDHGLDDFPGAWFDTAVLGLVYVAALVVGVLVDRGLLH